MSLSQTNSPPAAARLPAGVDSAAFNAIEVPPDRRPEALERLLAIGGVPDRSHVQRFLDFALSNKIDLDAMWSLLDESGRMTHTVLAVPSPGRTAMFFASHACDDADAAVVGGLLRHAAAGIALRDVHLAQALIDPVETLDRDMFLAGGFTELAHLSYMERPLARTRRGFDTQWPGDVTLHSFDDSHEEELLGILEATYEQTLDCPDLRGLRDTRDILVGHRSTGVFDPNLWTILRVDGKGAGALLLNPSPQQKSIELVYIGLAPEARGRGLGRSLLHYGLAITAGRRERTMTLAVDERNEPALVLYRAEKFRNVLRRIAMIQPLRQHAHAPA